MNECLRMLYVAVLGAGYAIKNLKVDPNHNIIISRDFYNRDITVEEYFRRKKWIGD